MAHSTGSPIETTRRHGARLGGPGNRGGPGGSPASWLRRLGRRRIWIASTAVFLVFGWAFFLSSVPFAIPEVEAVCGQRPPDMRFFTSADDVTGFLDACGPTGRNAYRNMQVADLVYPAVVGLFLASSFALVIGRLAPRASKAIWLASIPLVASAFDYLENIFAWSALARYPGSAPTDVVLGYASAAKTVTSWISGILLVGALAILGVRVVQRRLRPIQSVQPINGDPGEPSSIAQRALST